jgi:hypothetical protein
VISLLRAREVIKRFILLLFYNEEASNDTKIVTAILMTIYYYQFLFSLYHQITSAMEIKTNSFFELKHQTGSGTYLCLIINNILRDERRSPKPKTKKWRADEI